MNRIITLLTLFIIPASAQAQSGQCAINRVLSSVSDSGSYTAIAYTSSCTEGLQISLLSTAQRTISARGNIAVVEDSTANIKFMWYGDSTLHIQKEKISKLVKRLRSFNGVKINYDH
mgnify:CR=1 FL=1